MNKMTDALIAKNISKEYDGREIIKDISLTIHQGDIIAIFGPNGCGKSTLLNILAGLTEKTGGEVRSFGFNKKEFSYVFQNYRETLLPWKNNYQNLIFPLEIKKSSQSEISSSIEKLNRIFAFAQNFMLYPYQLSGGQQQILAFMRALITNPKMLFLDEPFSALDYENNLLLRNHLQKYYNANKPTILAVTHDIEEAAHIANKIVVLSKKPTRIVKIIQNKAPYPRTESFLKSNAFAKVRKEVLEEFTRGALCE